jgi:hypothetical protein
MVEALAGLLTVQLAFGCFFAVLGGIVNGFTGFGGGLLLVPSLAFFFGPVEGLAVIAGTVGAVQLFPGAARHADWAEVAPVSLAIVIGAPLGVIFLFNLDPDLVRRAMGGFVIAGALLMASGWTYGGRRGVAVGAATGGLCGLITGATGAGAPLIGLYFLAGPQPAEVQRANLVFSAAVLVAAVLVSIHLGGGLGWQTLARGALITPFYMLGVFGGERLFARSRKVFFRRAALTLLVITGLAALVA